MKRHVVASGATVLALTLGAGGALAADPLAPIQLAVPIQPEQVPQNPLLHFLATLLGIGDPPPGVAATAGAVHAASSGDGGVVTEQGLPITAAAAVSSPSNLDVPVDVVGGPTGGTAVQSSTSQATASAANDIVAQSVTPGGGQGGGGAASQSSATGQVVPVAIGAAISAPVNLNLPVGVLATTPAGDVSQTAAAVADATAINNRTAQAVLGGGTAGSASQTADSSQAIPIALGLAVAAPININLPIDILSGDGIGLIGGQDGFEGLLRGLLSVGREATLPGGTVTQTSTSQATGVAVNNAAEQSVATGGGAAAQESTSDQLIPAAVGAAVSLPLNWNLPIGVLQADALGGEPVDQENQAEASAEAINFDLNQSATQEGTGGTNTATQSSENTQLLPIAISTDLAVPINVNLPITLLGHPLFEDSTLDLSIVQRTLDAVDATLADPLGTLRHALLEDPSGTIDYLLNG